MNRETARLLRRSAALVFVGGLLVALGPSAAAAATIDVTTAADELDAGGAGSTGCSLREAISSGQGPATGGCTAGDAGLDTLTLHSGVTYLRTITGAAEEINASGDLDITDQLGIVVLGGGGAVIAGTTASGGDRVLDVASNVTLDRVEISGGHATGTDNGGGIRIRNSIGQLTLTNSAVVGNSTDGFGGGIANQAFATLKNVTLSGNTAGRSGGGLDTAGMSTAADFNNVTITANTADFGDPAGTDSGGGVNVFGSQATLRNTIVAGNFDASGGAPDCFAGGAVFFSLGNNLIGDTSGCTPPYGPGPGDVVNPPSVGLGPLAANGGPTRTHALLSGSPAIDGGDAASCEVTDQRGSSRSGARCDIGAFEFVPPGPATTTPTTTTATTTITKKCKKKKAKKSALVAKKTKCKKKKK